MYIQSSVTTVRIRWCCYPVSKAMTSSFLLGSGAGINWAVRLDRSRRGHSCLRVCCFSTGSGVSSIATRGDIDLNERRLRCSGSRQATERATARESAVAVLSPTLALDRDVGSGAKVLLELIAIYGVMVDGAGERKLSTTPSLRRILVLSGAELASGLCLLFERLLFLGVGVANLDLKLLAIRRDGMVVERLDDLFTRLAVLEPMGESAWGGCRIGRREGLTEQNQRHVRCPSCRGECGRSKHCVA
jgi:hypothetical protein